jgi:hypothetical protein
MLTYQISWKSVQWEPSCSMETERRTWPESNSPPSQFYERAKTWRVSSFQRRLKLHTTFYPYISSLPSNSFSCLSPSSYSSTTSFPFSASYLTAPLLHTEACHLATVSLTSIPQAHGAMGQDTRFTGVSVVFLIFPGEYRRSTSNEAMAVSFPFLSQPPFKTA